MYICYWVKKTSVNKVVMWQLQLSLANSRYVHCIVLPVQVPLSSNASSEHMHKLFVGLIRRTACACAQFSGCSSTNNAHSETGQMAVCCQNLPLGALSSRRASSSLVGELFKKFRLFWTQAYKPVRVWTEPFLPRMHSLWPSVTARYFTAWAGNRNSNQ